MSRTYTQEELDAEVARAREEGYKSAFVRTGNQSGKSFGLIPMSVLEQMPEEGNRIRKQAFLDAGKTVRLWIKPNKDNPERLSLLETIAKEIESGCPMISKLRKMTGEKETNSDR